MILSRVSIVMKRIGVYSALFLSGNGTIFLYNKQNNFLSDEGPMLETLDHTIRFGSTPTFLYFDLE